MLCTTCQTPEESFSQRVSALRSASSRKREERLLVGLETAAAATRRELLAVPLICSFTSNTQVEQLVALCPALFSGFSTTARMKFFWVSNSSGLPSPSISAVASQGCSSAPPGG